MARKEDIVIRSLIDAAIEIGVVKGVQAFAGKMAPLVMRLVREGKLNAFQISLALGWDGPFIYGNRINRKRFARIIHDRLQTALTVDANPWSDLAQHERNRQMELF